MSKKHIISALVSVLVITSLIGCGAKNANAEIKNNTTQVQSSQSEEKNNSQIQTYFTRKDGNLDQILIKEINTAQKSLNVAIYSLTKDNIGNAIITGVKGARVSLNKKGVRTSVGAGGIRYTESVPFKNNEKKNTTNTESSVSKTTNYTSKMQQNHTSEEIEEFRKEHYTRHIKLIFSGIACMFVGFVFLPVMFIAIILLITGIGCMIKNWRRINDEYKIRINK